MLRARDALSGRRERDETNVNRHNCSFIRIANDASRFLAGFSPGLTIGNHRAALLPVPAFLSLFFYFTTNQ